MRKFPPDLIIALYAPVKPLVPCLVQKVLLGSVPKQRTKNFPFALISEQLISSTHPSAGFAPASREKNEVVKQQLPGERGSCLEAAKLGETEAMVKSAQRSVFIGLLLKHSDLIRSRDLFFWHATPFESGVNEWGRIRLQISKLPRATPVMIRFRLIGISLMESRFLL